MASIPLWPAVAVTAAALLTSYALLKKATVPGPGRFSSLDGLRGYLALAVFLHHASIWFAYLRVGAWKLPPSSVYTHFGQASVALFFMITAFLFFHKLLEARTRGVDWLHLAVSRLLRIAPLYLFAVCCIALIVGVLTDWQLRDPPGKLIKQLIRWLSFTILGAPDLNGFPRSGLIVAHVTWSLCYEWFFYALLPLMAMALGMHPPRKIILLSLLCLAGIVWWEPSLIVSAPFAGGMLAAVLVRDEGVLAWGKGRSATLLCLACLILVPLCFATAYAPLPIALLSFAFLIVASGNTLFGVLNWRVSRMLGSMAYSIYLLHGIVLFVALNIAMAPAQAAAMGETPFWMMIVLLTPVLVCISFLSYSLIEKPALRRAGAVSTMLRRIQLRGVRALA